MKVAVSSAEPDPYFLFMTRLNASHATSLKNLRIPLCLNDLIMNKLYIILRNTQYFFI